MRKSTQGGPAPDRLGEAPIHADGFIRLHRPDPRAVCIIDDRREDGLSREACRQGEAEQ